MAKTLSMAFFSTAGTLWLYSGVTKRYASPAAIVSFHRRTTGAENAGFARVADGGEGLIEHGQVPVPQVEDTRRGTRRADRTAQ